MGWIFHSAGNVAVASAMASASTLLPSQRRYVIDIKSHRGDPTNQGSDKDWDAVLEQLRRQARELAAEPIVWQPRATRQKVIRVAEVAYVPGDASELRAYLEMRGGLGAAAD